MKVLDLGFRRYSVVLLGLVAVFVLEIKGTPISVEGAAALVGMIAGYCGFDAAIKRRAVS